MSSSAFCRLSKACKVPAGVAVASTSVLFFGEYGSVNTSRRYASNVSTAASEALLQNSAKRNKSVAASPAPPKAMLKGTGSRSMVEWYESHLNSNPVRTKMITGGFLWGLGDIVAQAVPPIFFPSEDEESHQSSYSGTPGVLSNYDFQRTGRAIAFGSIIHAPCAHIHYNFLESLTVKAGISGLQIPVFKAFMEQFVYWSWFSNSLYHGAMGAMQGQTTSQIYDRIADVLWETQKAQWVFWIPIQLLNFRFVPVRHQLNVVLLTSVVWTALLSAWYPPSEEEEKVKKIKE